MEELKAQLAQAQATISSYASQAQDGGLRMRKSDSTAATTSSAEASNLATVQGSQGVPIQIVAALCLLSFLLAYIFF